MVEVKADVLEESFEQFEEDGVAELSGGAGFGNWLISYNAPAPFAPGRTQATSPAPHRCAPPVQVSTIILSATGSTVIVRDLPRGTVESGCRIELREGCDKRFATCVSRFANAVNFRGEPHLPGNDLLTRYPGA